MTEQDQLAERIREARKALEQARTAYRACVKKQADERRKLGAAFWRADATLRKLAAGG